MKHILYILLIILSSCCTTKNSSKDKSILDNTHEVTNISKDSIILIEWEFDNSDSENLQIPYNIGNSNIAEETTKKATTPYPPPRKGHIKITKASKTSNDISKTKEIGKSEKKASVSEKTKQKQYKVLKLRWWEILINCSVAFIICFFVKKWGLPEKILGIICPNRK